MDSKPLGDWAIQYRLHKDNIIAPIPFDDMDWEQYIFYIGLTEAIDRESLKQQKAAEAKAKEARRKR